MATQNQKFIRITILIKKVDRLTHSEFNEYWRNKHPKVFLSVPIAQKNIVKYSQVISPGGIELFMLTGGFRSTWIIQQGLKVAGLPVAEYDGGVNFWVRSVEDFMAVCIISFHLSPRGME
jgi:hypothetical protein